MKFKMKKILLAYLLMTSILFATQKVKEKDLAQKHQEWLKLTRYIILPAEKEVFMELTNDRDRDIFIQTFWKQRDPTQGTPQNEYKDEHVQRFRYATEYFRRGTTRAGWMTDMGRMYIILGPPISIEKFEGIPGIYPSQVWSYYGDKKKGLPTHFNLVFFQRSGAGEFKLHNSLADGPASIIIDKRGLDLNNHLQLYQKIKQLAPTLAGPSISMIPGQYPAGYRPSLRDNLILSDIIESPKKDVSSTYATHFLNYKGTVSTEYLINYVESITGVEIIQDPILNIDFVHFSISPERVSIDYFEPNDQYFCNFKLSVSLRKEENIIFQYSKDFPFYFPPENIERIRGSGIAIQDSFPMIEGEYTLTILVQNSVGKEFSVSEKEIFVAKRSDTPEIIGPILGYRLQDYSSHLNVPFRLMGKKLLVDPKNTFSLTEDVAIFFNIKNVTKHLWEDGKVEIYINGLRPKEPVKRSYILDLKNYPFHETLGLTYSIPAKELSPDYYEMKLVLKDRDSTVVEKKSNFIISPQEVVAHPLTLAKSFPLSNNYLYFYSIAYQYDKVTMPEKAENFYKLAYESNPDFKGGLVEYAQFLLKVRKFAESMRLIEDIRDNEEFRFQYYLLKGKAYLGMENYSEAIINFLEGNKIYNSDTSLLNSLGFCYYKTGETEKALDVLKASLSLNPEQKGIKALIAEIEKK
jgi:GWxTD domain-containing protein